MSSLCRSRLAAILLCALALLTAPNGFGQASGTPVYSKVDSNPTFVYSQFDPAKPLRLIAYGDMRFANPSLTQAMNPKVRSWLAAKVGGELALRLRLPSVAGELAAGILLGGLHHLHGGFPDPGSNPSLALLGNLGVIVLMFAVGLESTVPQMLKVGLPALRVACLEIDIDVPEGTGTAASGGNVPIFKAHC